jgi:hypothetical protein
MNRLTKFALAASAVISVCSAPVFGSDGIFGSGIILNIQTGVVGDNDTSSFSNGTNLFEFSNQGEAQYSPSANAPAHYDSSNNWSGSITSPTVSLGSFDSVGDTLSIAGGEVLTYESSGNQAQGAQLFYEISQGGVDLFGANTFKPVPGSGIFAANSYSATYVGGSPSLGEDSLNASGSGNGDARFYSNNMNISLLQYNGQPLTNGTYSLTIYAVSYETYSNGGGSGQFSPAADNDSGNNYNATFTVVPEPSAVMMLLSSSLFGSFYLLRRRKR